MRRTATILAVVALMVVSSSGVALAAYEVSMPGTDGEDIISGTEKSEHISGLGGDDRLNGGGGDDLVEGGLGSDELGDGRGRDTVNADDGADNLIGQGGDISVRQRRRHRPVEGYPRRQGHRRMRPGYRYRLRR